MSWMIGQNGRTSMPSCRLDIGAKPNINIHSTKITNVNYGDGSNMMFPNGMGYGMNMYGMPSYGNNCYSRTEGIMAAIGMLNDTLTNTIEVIKNVKGAKETKVETPQQTQSAATTEATQRYNNLLEENKKLKEAADLLQEGITTLPGGSYAVKVQGANGQNIDLYAATASGIKSKKEQIEALVQKGLVQNTDGSFSIKIKDPSGKEIEVKAANISELPAKLMQAQLENGIDATMVNDSWTEMNNKTAEELSEAEQNQIATDYLDAISSFAVGLSHSLGGEKGKISLEEFTEHFLKTTLGENASETEKAQAKEDAKLAFSRMDLDGKGTIGADEIAGALMYIDGIEEPDGKITGNDYKNFMQKLAGEDDSIKEELLISKNLFFGEE